MMNSFDIPMIHLYDQSALYIHRQMFEMFVWPIAGRMQGLLRDSTKNGKSRKGIDSG
jgi:hypothetical protein